jgi:hypothetical protein
VELLKKLSRLVNGGRQLKKLGRHVEEADHASGPAAMRSRACRHAQQVGVGAAATRGIVAGSDFERVRSI